MAAVTLDDAFLEELGLSALPPKARHELLQHTYSELEMRVGEKLTDGMSGELLDEFDRFIEKDGAATDAWLAVHAPDWRTVATMPGGGPAPKDKFEFASAAWLLLNRPDYPDVVADQLAELKLELLEGRDDILAAFGGRPTPAGARGSH